jgi:hypothetical protein
MRVSPDRLLVGGVFALSLATLGLQALVLRPHLWPAGAGVALSGDTVMGAQPAMIGMPVFNAYANTAGTPVKTTI